MALILLLLGPLLELLQLLPLLLIPGKVIKPPPCTISPWLHWIVLICVPLYWLSSKENAQFKSILFGLVIQYSWRAHRKRGERERERADDMHKSLQAATEPRPLRGTDSLSTSGACSTNWAAGVPHNAHFSQFSQSNFIYKAQVMYMQLEVLNMKKKSLKREYNIHWIKTFTLIK